MYSQLCEICAGRNVDALQNSKQQSPARLTTTASTFGRLIAGELAARCRPPAGAERRPPLPPLSLPESLQHQAGGGERRRCEAGRRCCEHGRWHEQASKPPATHAAAIAGSSSSDCRQLCSSDECRQQQHSLATHSLLAAASSGCPSRDSSAPAALSGSACSEQSGAQRVGTKRGAQRVGHKARE